MFVKAFLAKIEQYINIVNRVTIQSFWLSVLGGKSGFIEIDLILVHTVCKDYQQDVKSHH